MQDKNKIKKILVISLSNIGDVVLTFPTLDAIKKEFPQASMDLIVGPKAGSLVLGNPSFRKVFIYDKKQPLGVTLKWIYQLILQKYDLAVDLRNTAIPFLIFAKHKTSVVLPRVSQMHMSQVHFLRGQSVCGYPSGLAPKISLAISSSDKVNVDRLLKSSQVHNFVVLAPGSRAENKRWPQKPYAQLADYLAQKYFVKIIFAGDKEDVSIVSGIVGMMENKPLDFTGKLNLKEFGYLLSLSSLAVVNDSAPLHLASYLDVPVAAIFGPTDPQKFGPWGSRCVVVRKNRGCPLCCGDGKSLRHTCIEAVKFEDALKDFEPFFSEVLNAKKIS